MVDVAVTLENAVFVTLVVAVAMDVTVVICGVSRQVQMAPMMDDSRLSTLLHLEAFAS